MRTQKINLFEFELSQLQFYWNCNWLFNGLVPLWLFFVCLFFISFHLFVCACKHHKSVTRMRPFPGKTPGFVISGELKKPQKTYCSMCTLYRRPAKCRISNTNMVLNYVVYIITRTTWTIIIVNSMMATIFLRIFASCWQFDGSQRLGDNVIAIWCRQWSHFTQN